MRSRRLALATYRRLPDLAPDDRLLIPALATLGITAAPLVWDDGAAQWGDLDAVVVRSCWDYHLRLGEFLHWLERLEQRGIPVLNPPALVRWNTDKSYLLDLAARGIAIVPTHRVQRGGITSLSSVLDQLETDEAVVKPAVSASAHATWRTSQVQADGDDEQFRTLVAAGDVLVQPLVRAIAESGEWSLVCFGGAASHAVLKRPAAGDWRVQVELGGSAKLCPGPAALVQGAGRVLAAARAEGSAYARVDGYLENDGLVLMELELIEPQLFLELESRAPERFARAIAAALCW